MSFEVALRATSNTRGSFSPSSTSSRGAASLFPSSSSAAPPSKAPPPKAASEALSMSMTRAKSSDRTG
eukprot:CAMPEP_0172597350 /NCGR_PEP_ID=MMETSP1068-20121228/17338_1 /TAXON_ID=35684 /ORGANISM="Pseudopedinella elastica, Strain CCMP716" /LENGTH=67 /DNA_ID=CAMNT_0013396835 /DNA_START=334 /DNA_END=537 /DNA_ORIENTATION=+